jgi:hypothetical protein
MDDVKDARPLWEILEENQRLKDAEWDEKVKISLASRSLLQEDDLRYLANLEEDKKKKLAEIERENREAIKEFRLASQVPAPGPSISTSTKRSVKKDPNMLEGIVKKRKTVSNGTLSTTSPSKGTSSNDGPSTDSTNSARERKSFKDKPKEEPSALSLLAQYSDDD